MNEDGFRIRRDSAAEKFDFVRHTSLNILKKETSFNKCVRAKQLKADDCPNFIFYSSHISAHKDANLEILIFKLLALLTSIGVSNANLALWMPLLFKKTHKLRP